MWKLLITYYLPVPKLSSPQSEQRPESMRLEKYLHPVGVSYTGIFITFATLEKTQ